MIDIHCHLLPNIDDGSDSAEKSLEQLKLMAAGGINHAFLTAHYISGYSKYDRAEYDAKLLQMQNLAQENQVKICLHQGFEIFIHPNSLEEITAYNLTLGKSRYVLVESDLNGLTDDFYNYLFPLLRKGYKPILAHAERYVSIMQKPREAKKLIDRDVYLQVNSGSLLGLYGEKVRQTAWVLIRNGWAHLLASDDHVRGPYGSFFKALDLLRADLDGNVVDLLAKEFPRLILTDKPIPRKYVYLRPTHEHHRKKRKKNLWQRIFS